MKKLIAFALALVMLLAFAACTKSTTPTTAAPEKQETKTEAAPAAEAKADTNWPTKPITLLCGYSAGGSSDLGCRYLAEALREELGQPVVVENVPGSGSWCFVSHESARTDRIELIGDRGQLCFSVFTYDPIVIHTSEGRQEFVVENPPHVQLPLIQKVVEHLQGTSICTADCVSATSVNWVMDRILGKI